MSSDRSASTSWEFVAIAQREGLLPADSAAGLTRDSEELRVSPAQLALQRGLLTQIQVEIIETLLKPRAAVAGYEILGLLGYGGMGIVYRARQLSLGRIVALKTVLLNAKTNPSRLARFEQEAQTVGRLLHPHIITAYDFGRDGNRVYFAMEMVTGEDLERRIDREGPLSEATAWGLIRQAAAGLAQAAEFGVVHRDIKPANLLLVAPPKGFPLHPGLPMVKIADFGLALISGEDEERTRLTMDNTTVGSPHYMAPEQLTGAEIDLRADIYALGATGYHMFAGRPPFDGLTLPQIFARKLNGAPAPLISQRTGLSAETITLVGDLMASDREHRIANYAELMDRIDELLRSTQSDSVSRAATTSVHLKPQRTVPTDTRRGGVATQTNFPSRSEDLAPPAPQKLQRRAFEIVWRSLVAVLLISGGVYAVSLWTDPFGRTAVRPGMELKPSGVAADLFDGRSLAKWRVLAGNWQTAQDDEDVTVLAASGGLIARRVAFDHPGQSSERLEHYRLRFTVALREATAIDVFFGMHNPGSEIEAKSVLRIERDRVTLSRFTAATPQFTQVAPPLEWAHKPNQYHEIKIERQAAEWRAYIDDRLIGTVPLAANEFQVFRLAVSSREEHQFAWFADFVLEELVPP